MDRGTQIGRNARSGPPALFRLTGTVRIVFGNYHDRSGAVRFISVRTLSVGVAALAATACASGGGGGGSSSLAADAAAGKIGPAFLEWAGNFKATQQMSREVTFQNRNRAAGTVVFTASGPAEMHVVMDATIDDTDPDRLSWALVPGACGSPGFPVMTVAQFPPLTAHNGRATLDDVIPVPLPVTGSYHVNIFSPGTSGSEQTDVMICASLSLRRKSS